MFMTLGGTIVIVLMAAVICLLWGEVCKNYGYNKAIADKQAESEKAKTDFMNLLKGLKEQNDD